KIPACMSCHGPNGAGMPDIYPRIGGQHADYIVEQMTAFRTGQRVHNMMDPIATRLSDDEIAAVANYVQGLE
ncbi:MAG: cytochrome c, partial [Neisseriaceae bacterium]|nr:cytochrome c [Neisseriaceae bacterium]